MSPAAVRVPFARRVADLYHDFEKDPLGTTVLADSGQTWRYHTGSGGSNATLRSVAGSGGVNKLSNVVTAVGQAAGYIQRDMGAPVTTMYGVTSFEAGTNHGSCANMAVWKGGYIGDLAGVPDSPCHAYHNDQKWNVDTITGGVFTSIGSGWFATPLVADGATKYSWQVAIDYPSSSMIIILPDGTSKYIEHPSIAANAGNFACAEVFQTDASTDVRPAWHKFQAGTHSRAQGAPALGPFAVGMIARGMAGGKKGVAKGVHLATAAISTAPTGSATLVHSSLQLPVVFPDSGKLLVKLHAQVTVGAGANRVFWLLFGGQIQEAANRSASDVASSFPVTLEFIHTGTPGSAATLQWYHQATASGASIKLDTPNARIATMSAVPLESATIATT